MDQYQDSTGQPIGIGDAVRFRGQTYTIKDFYPGEGRSETARIEFTQPVHTNEVPDEISVDLITAVPDH